MRVFITGATGGLGGALVRTLLADSATERLWAAGRSADRLANLPSDPRLVPLPLDVTDETSGERAAQRVLAEGSGLDLVVQAAALLHDDQHGLQPEKRIEQVGLEGLQRSFAVNAIGPALIARALLPALTHGRPATMVNVSARVGSIEDNGLGGWYGYRASKAAQNQITRTLAIECRRRAPQLTLIAYHPGTVATSLSAPFRRPAKPGVMTPDEAAARLLDVVGGLTPAASGSFYAWDGKRIPW